MDSWKIWIAVTLFTLPLVLWACPVAYDDDDDASGSASCFYGCQGAYGDNWYCTTEPDALADCETWAYDSCGDMAMLDHEAVDDCGGCNDDCAPSWYGASGGDDDDDTYGDDDTYY